MAEADALDLLAGVDADSEDHEDTGEQVTLIVCDATGKDGQVCGEHFDTPGRLNQHRWQKHRLRTPAADKMPRKPGKKTKSKTRTPRERATATATAAPVDRVAGYTAGLAMLGLGVYLAPGPFDEYDLAVLNNGAPNLASALDAVGERNPVVRDACDLILGGGVGGPYAALVFAVLGIAGPILSHHRVLPASVGERFGQVVGAPSAPAPVSEAPATPPERERTAADIVETMSGVSEPPTADYEPMGDGAPIVVAVPDVIERDNMTRDDLVRAHAAGLVTDAEYDYEMRLRDVAEPGPEQADPNLATVS